MLQWSYQCVAWAELGKTLFRAQRDICLLQVPMETFFVSQSLHSTLPHLAGSGEPPCGRAQDRLALELPTSLTEVWCGTYLPSDGPAIVTVGWVCNVAVVAVLLVHDRVPVALSLDPSQQQVVDALSQWSECATLTLTLHQGDAELTLEVHVHIDAVVRALMTSCERTQTADDFHRAVAAYSEMEHMLSRLAGSHRIKWTVGRLTSVLERARLTRPLHSPQGCDASPAC